MDVKMRKLGTWQGFDNRGEVSWVVMKAYAVSLLLLASVLVWTVGRDDLWTQYYGYSTPLESVYNSNFTLVGLSM